MPDNPSESDTSNEEIANTLKSLSSLNDIETADGLTTVGPPDRGLDDDMLPVDWGDGFQLLQKLASGMTGAYLAKQQRLSDHLYVMKILWDPTPRAVQRFEAEAAILGRLHKVGIRNIPFPVFSGWHDGFPYIVMEHINGKTIKQLLDDDSWKPSLADIVDLIRQTTTTLSAAHRVGAIHRDIKPSNLVLANDGTTYVIDFGISKDEHTESPTTETGVAAGTHSYMSPEQLAGKKASYCSDIFSLGVVFQELLEQLPKNNSSPNHTMAHALAERMTERSQERRASSNETLTQLDAILNSTAQRSSPSRSNLLVAATCLGIGCLGGWLMPSMIQEPMPDNSAVQSTARPTATISKPSNNDQEDETLPLRPLRGPGYNYEALMDYQSAKGNKPSPRHVEARRWRRLAPRETSSGK